MGLIGRFAFCALAGLACAVVASSAEPAEFSSAELQKLIALADATVKAAEAQKHAVGRGVPAEPSFELMMLTELKAHFSDPPGYISSREQRGWKVVGHFARELFNGPAHADKQKALSEVLHAIRNNHLRPAPTSIHFLAEPIMFWDHVNNPIGHGETRASNLRTDTDARDLSRLDPEPSTFWERPAPISSQDLSTGFGRSAPPRYETNLWEYVGPKTSWGGCPGFDARCGNLEIKVKLSETRSEPFTARIFHALGFHADPTDHAPFLKINYSRRLFREFHLRKDLKMRLRSFGIPVHTINLQKRYDPFSFIAEAVLKDGTRLSGKQLKTFLLRNVRGKFPEDDPANFRSENEAQVDYLVTTAANIQLSDTAWKPIGPWTFDQLGHEHLRELRGAGLLAAWLGWYDSRFENMRLKICETNGQLRLAHFFNDLGGGLGKSVGVFSRPMERPDLFRRTFTSPRKFQGKGKMTIPFRIRHFQPIDDTASFEQMTMDDARWMARLIAQLTEQQIFEALTASGFSPDDVRTYTEKLISRRDRMIHDLELEKKGRGN
jgi:hypothetical protein